MTDSDSTICAAAPVSPPKIGDEAPDFIARTTHGRLRLSDLRGHWVLLFSHPADFTPVCTSEFLAFATAFDQFQALDCALVGLSVDSLPAHLAWIEAIRAQFGVTIPFPIIEDPSMAIARAYGMLDLTADSSATVRTVHVIDPDGTIRAITWYPMSVGRSVAEMLRLVAALQKVSTEDVLTPEGWQPGHDTVLPAVQTQQDAAEAGPAWFMRTRPDPRA
ncbi:peroxiredoxin [Gluconacetobacter sp. 1b LMG 1731]|uniref:Thioredoxin peroxidase n=1 Tax=Gluconacetobacter dulcium TaxID=2729096 RepID=A0A7W4ILK7_9PROT|nr:peroxiredoxin [Gluconacetobacter dulcium]MBB2165125.1 peroxiredoxin [Gluconacetobacter dulcium]MBB2194249.1 peroxiredoxin [Gluconacetobacter dulcium]MBB2197038.1 peroxiredoxin [Gluconacetobacter dulcium]